MRKKVPVRHLSPGMFIQAFCCNWLAHPFPRSSFLIKTAVDIMKITASKIEYVYIDTARRLDVADAQEGNASQPFLDTLDGDFRSATRSHVTTPIQEELEHARRGHARARQALKNS